MSKVTKSTKAGNLSQTFKQAAASDGDGALSFMLMAAFGVSLTMLMAIAEKALTSKDVSLIILALTAGVQIRNHVVFVGAEHAGIKSKYPELIIDGIRDQADQFNFSALHVLGHLFAHLGSAPLAHKILSKAGSSISGDMTTDSEAGKVNKELANSWPQQDKNDWQAWNMSAKSKAGPDVDAVMVSVSAKAKAFSAKMLGTTKGASSAATSIS